MTCPTAAGPSYLTATTQPPSPILVAREGAEQSQGSSKACNPTFPTAGVHGGRTGNILHAPSTVPPSGPHHCAASTAGWMGHEHWSCTNFSGHGQAGQSSDGLGGADGSPGPTWAPVLTFLSPCQSGNAMLQPCSLQDPAVWRQTRAVSPPSQPCSRSDLNPMGKEDSSPGSHWDTCLRARTEAWTWGCQDSCRQVYSQHRAEVGNTGWDIPCSFSQAFRHNLLKSLGWGFPTNSALPPSATSRGNATVIYK